MPEVLAEVNGKEKNLFGRKRLQSVGGSGSLLTMKNKLNTYKGFAYFIRANASKTMQTITVQAESFDAARKVVQTLFPHAHKCDVTLVKTVIGDWSH